MSKIMVFEAAKLANLDGLYPQIIDWCDMNNLSAFLIYAHKESIFHDIKYKKNYIHQSFFQDNNPGANLGFIPYNEFSLGYIQMYFPQDEDAIAITASGKVLTIVLGLI